MNAEEMHKSLEEHARETHSKAERDLLPAPLVRERDFCREVWLWVGLVYSLPWLYFGFKSLTVLNDGPLWENWPSVWRMGLAAIFGWYHVHAAKHKTGLFYPMDLWEQSIARRIEEWRSQNSDKTDVLNKLQNPLSYM